jgi:hypothetical protein
VSLPPAVVGQVEQLQLPDVLRPERMPSWPAWVASHIGLLKIDEQPDPKTGRYRPIPTLPASSILTAAKRKELERHAKQLDGLLKYTPDKDGQAEQDVVMAVTEMMLVYWSQTQTDLSVEARGRAMVTAALSDVPAWAVQAAIRRWHRGECGRNEKGQPYDNRWCPAPAELRAIALAELHPLNERLNTVETLLRAEPRIEYSDEHRRRMRERFAELSRTLRASPVGKDGSGGGISAS